MKVTLEKKDSVSKRYHVEFETGILEERENKSLSMLAKTVQIRGFRKGKVPLYLVRQMYGANVREETIREIMNEGLREAMENEDMEIVGVSDVEPAPYKKGEPFRFSFTAETLPKIEEIDYSGVEVWHEETEITDEQVDEEMQNLREFHAEVIPLEDQRPAAQGDVVKIGRSEFKDGEWVQLPPEEGIEIVIGKGMVPPEIESQLTGKSVGEIFDASLPNPEDSSKEIRYRFIIKDIKERRLPELDDEFAKDVGLHETLEELTSYLREKMLEESGRRSNIALKNSILAELRTKNPLDLPPSLVEDRLKELLGTYGLKPDDASINEESMEIFKSKAEHSVYSSILLRELQRLEKIEVTDHDLEDFYKKESDRTGDPVPKIKAAIRKQENMENIRALILEDKILDLVKARITIHKGTPPAEDNPESESEKSSKQEKTTKTDKEEKNDE